MPLHGRFSLTTPKRVDTTLFLGFPQRLKFPKLNSSRQGNCSVRRLFSTFARGWPGIGLLLLRLVVGIALIWRAVEKPNSDPSFQMTVLIVLAIGLGLLLLVGLWTPVAGTLVAGIQLCEIAWKLGDPWIYTLLAAMGAALAMAGPGFWSVDARLYGWKRIDPASRKS